MALKTLEVKIGANTTGFDKGVRKVETGVKSMVSGFSSLAKSALALGGITLGVSGLAQAVKGFIGLESSMKRTGEIFRSSFTYIDDFAQNAAKGFGMAQGAAYEYSAVYGNLFKGITSSTEENAKVTLAMLQASAVIASKTGRTIEDVNDRIRSGILGNTEAIEDLGINVPVAMIKTTKAFKQMADGKPWEELTYQVQQQIRAMAILEQSHTNFGDTIQKGSAFGLQALSGAFKDLMATVGAFVNSALKPVVDWLTAVVQTATTALKSLAAFLGFDIKVDLSTYANDGTNAQNQFGDEVKETTKELKKQQRLLSGFDVLNVLDNSDGADVSPGNGKSPFEKLEIPEYSVSIKEPNISWIKTVSNAVKGFVDKLKNLFAPSILAWGDAFNKIKAPITTALQNIGLRISELWYNTLAPFGGYLVFDFVPTVANAFSNSFAPIFADVMPVLLATFAKDFNFVANQIDNAIKDIITPAFDGLKIVATDVFASITKAWNTHGVALLDGFAKVRDGLRETWNNIYNTIVKPIVDNIGVKIGELWREHLKPLVDKSLNYIGTIGRGLMDLWNTTLKPIVDWLIKVFSPQIKFVWDLATTQIKNAIGVIVDRISFMFDTLSGLVDVIVGVLTGNFERAFKGIKTMFQSVIDSIVSIISFPINLFIDGLNVMIRAANALGANIAEIPKIGGKKDDKPQPPPPPPTNNSSGKGGVQQAFAVGGVVTKPTVAQIGERGKEVVMPLENNTGWIDELASRIAFRNTSTATAGASGGETRVYIGNDEFQSYIIRTVRDHLARTNGRM